MVTERLDWLLIGWKCSHLRGSGLAHLAAAGSCSPPAELCGGASASVHRAAPGIIGVLTWIRLNCSRFPFRPPTVLVSNLHVFCLIRAENASVRPRTTTLCCISFCCVTFISFKSVRGVLLALSMRCEAPFLSRTEPHAKAANIYFFSPLLFFLESTLI